VTATTYEEREALRDTVRALFAARSPSTAVRTAMAEPAGFDRVLWRTLANEVGVQGLAVPEPLGGAGYGWPEMAVVLEESARALAVTPLLSTLVATAVLTAADDTSYLPRIATGEAVVTVAHLATGRGVADHVIDGADADAVLVVDDGRLYAVEGAPAEPLPTLDQTRHQARVDLSVGVATEVGAVTAEEVQTAVAIALCAESVGVARRCLEMSADHARTRMQFGRPIGSFQAVKHACADMLIKVELAHSAADAAAASGDHATALTSAAYCLQATYDVAASTIQVHGGIGFTWEHDAHLYFKRATSNRLLLGDARVPLPA
jgi:alkylation response protein AidB-like acyl-CoA dehydrogenase